MPRFGTSGARRLSGTLARALALALTVTGCNGSVGGAAPAGGSGAGATGGAGGGVTLPAQDGAMDQAPSSALRRLSRREVENTLSDVLGISGLTEKNLPPDLLSPFDTDVTSKEASPVFVQGLESLASDVAQALVADQALLTAIAGCSASSADDAACLAGLAANLGRKLWRRPLSDAELTPLLTAARSFAGERNDFSVGVRSVVSSLLQSPSFIYRPEVGTSAGALHQLDNFELASKLSYWLWGSAPDASLLDRAAGAEFTSDALGEIATGMLTDGRADRQILTFHEQWLGFAGLRVDRTLAPAMLKETHALLQKVLVDERGRWSDLLTSTVTFVEPALSLHYGLATVTDSLGAWVSYTRPEQVGLLAHGSVLSLASRNTDDTSPTIRGKYFATRFMCWSVPPPPPNVNPDNPPQADANTCKSEAYALHRDSGGACATCHKLMDPIGFGLERLDGLGRYRTTEKQNAACAISGEGELSGIGTFNGLKGLVDLALANQDVQKCAVKHYLRFSSGRVEALADEPALSRLTAEFLASGEDFRALLLRAVSDPVFRYRMEEP